ncbi:MAG: sigma-54-dependent Fis family transcriptional regulator [Kiritimatiellae bacterium]|nr:sigma-54-dependent Fis family transcriptional regulator [Kiritimatiellia bacterium]
MLKGPIIFVDDETHVRRSVDQTLRLAGYAPVCLGAAEPALEPLFYGWPGIVVTDVKLPRTDGLELMRRVLAVDPDIPVVLVTAHGGVPMAVQAIRDGAYDFIEKPFASDMLVDTVQRALEKRALVLENRGLRLEIAGQGGGESPIKGKSPAIQKLRQTIANVADSDADVLITGETGSGKELVARELHAYSARRKKRLVPVNCGAIPETIMESEMFGHEPGAFTGARDRRIGKFEFADGGTLFLDEIESMPPHLQVKLLRVLQERVIERLGSNSRIAVDVRIIAASKIDLQRACEEERFRRDLFYRLNVVRIHVPPLRERRDDIPLLFQNFLVQSAAQYGRTASPVTPNALRQLMQYDWPGNVRELQNAAERYVLQGEQEWLTPVYLHSHSSDRGTPIPQTLSLKEQTHAFEKAVIEQELQRQGGSIRATCEALAIPRKTLYDKMARYNLKRADFAGRD